MRCQGSKAVQTGAHLWFKLQAETNLKKKKKASKTHKSNTFVKDKKVIKV